MMKEIRDAFFVIIFQILLDTYGKLLPRRFLQNDKIPKESLEFTLYLKILGAYMYTLKRIEEHDRSFIAKLQERRLRKILRVANRTKWWHWHFSKNNIAIDSIRNYADFKYISPVNRTDLIDVPKQDILTLPTEDNSIVWQQSGGSTTGTPIVWGLNKTIPIINMLAHSIKELECGNFSLEKDGLRNFHMTFNYSRSSALGLFKWFSNGNLFLNNGDKNLGNIVQEISKIITNLDKAVIQCSPSELKFLVDNLKDYNLRPHVLCFYLLGQTLEENTRRMVTEYLKCKIIVRYGTQETGGLAMECRKHHGLYHIFSERAIIEILDDNGQTVSPNTVGNITVTCLDNTVMPLIRYQPGDIGVLYDNLLCDCENKSPLLEIKNRTTDVIKFSNGEERSARRILRQFNKEPFASMVRRFQVRQDVIDEVIILLEVKEHIPEKFIAALKKRMSSSYRDMLTIHIKQTSLIPQDGPKFKVFVPLKN